MSFNLFEVFTRNKAFRIFIIKILSVLFNFYSIYILSNNLSLKQFGIFSVLLAAINILSTLFVFGTDQMLMREASFAISRKSYSLLNGLRLFTSTLSLSFFILISFVCIVLNNYIFNGVDITLLAICLIAILFKGMLFIQQRLLRSYSMIYKSQIPELIIRPFLLIILSLLSIKYLNFNITIAFTCLFVSYLISYFCSKYFEKAFEIDLNLYGRTYNFKDWFISSSKFSFVNITSIVLREADTILLGIFQDFHGAAVYAVLKRLLMFAAFGLTSVNFVYGSTFAKLYAKNDYLSISNIYFKCIREAFLLTLPIYIFIISFGSYILPLFNIYDDKSYYALIIILFTEIAHLIFGPAQLLLNMTENENITLQLLFVITLIKLVLCILLIPYYGFIGCCYATVLSYSVLYGFSYLYVKRLFNLNFINAFNKT